MYLKHKFHFSGGTAWQQPPGYYPNLQDTHPQPNFPQSSNYGATHSTTVIVPEIILVGGCPACRVNKIILFQHNVCLCL